MNFLLEVSSQKMPASNLASSQRCEDMWKAFMNGKWRKAQDKHAWSRSHVSAIRRNILSGRNSPLDISFILNLSCGEADSSVGFNLELKKKKKRQPWPVWLSRLEHCSVQWEAISSIPDHGTCRDWHGCGLDPQSGCAQEATDRCFSYSCFFRSVSLLLSLKWE